MEQKHNRKKMFLSPRVLGAEDGNALSRHGTEYSINSTVDLKDSPKQSSVASPSASSSSFFRSLSESRSLKFSSFSSPAIISSNHTEAFR